MVHCADKPSIGFVDLLVSISNGVSHIDGLLVEEITVVIVFIDRLEEKIVLVEQSDY